MQPPALEAPFFLLVCPHPRKSWFIPEGTADVPQTGPFKLRPTTRLAADMAVAAHWDRAGRIWSGRPPRPPWLPPAPRGRGRLRSLRLQDEETHTEGLSALGKGTGLTLDTSFFSTSEPRTSVTLGGASWSAVSRSHLSPADHLGIRPLYPGPSCQASTLNHSKITYITVCSIRM